MENNHPSISKFRALVELKDDELPMKNEYVRRLRRPTDQTLCDMAVLS